MSAAHRLYAQIVCRAREPLFYRDGGVPDTIDGRFEMIALHAFLVLHRLQRESGPAATLAQSLFDLMFADMDANLREMGAGDLGVGRRVKRMATAFYGRIAAYRSGLEASDDVLSAALERNLYGTASPQAEQLAAMTGYVRRAAASLDGRPLRSLLGGIVEFGPADLAPAIERGAASAHEGR